MIDINGKVYRNLQEQVLENTEDIADLQDNVEDLEDTCATKTELANGLETKQDTLVSGTNIKTINNESIVGSGNVEIEAKSYTAGTGITISSDTISIDNTVALKTDIPAIDEDIIPKAFNTYVLGDNTYSYKEVVANKFKSPNSYYEVSGANVSGHGQVTIKTTDGNGTDEAKLQLGNTGLYSNKNIAPMSGSTVNLGQANNGFNNLYLDGKIITDDNLTYGLQLPDTTSYTTDKTIVTTDQLPTNIITNIYSTGVAVRDTINQNDYYINGVEANPTLAGTESNLTGIQIGSTKYKITALPTYTISNVVTDSSDVLGIQVTDGSITYNVNNTEANPTLSGTETALSSIDIGGTYYKVASGIPTVLILNSQIDMSQTYPIINLTSAQIATITSNWVVAIAFESGEAKVYEKALEPDIMLLNYWYNSYDHEIEFTKIYINDTLNTGEIHVDIVSAQ